MVMEDWVTTTGFLDPVFEARSRLEDDYLVNSRCCCSFPSTFTLKTIKQLPKTNGFFTMFPTCILRKHFFVFAVLLPTTVR